MLKLLLWHGQLITPSASLATSQPWWVQTLLNALNVPAVGWVITWSPTILPPPSGMSATAASTAPPLDPPELPEPPPSAGLLPAGAGSLEKPVPLVLPPELPVPQAARTEVAPSAPAPSRTTRRLGVAGRPGSSVRFSASDVDCTSVIGLPSSACSS